MAAEAGHPLGLGVGQVVALGQHPCRAVRRSAVGVLKSPIPMAAERLPAASQPLSAVKPFADNIAAFEPAAVERIACPGQLLYPFPPPGPTVAKRGTFSYLMLASKHKKSRIQNVYS